MARAGGRRGAAVGAGLLALILIVAAVAVRSPERGDADPAPTHTKLYLPGIGSLTVIDVGSERVRELKVPEIGAGDPPYLIAAVGQRLALWSYDVFSVPMSRPGARPDLIARHGWIFIPSADHDAIWVGFLAPGRNRARRLGELREIDGDGKVLARGVAPPHGEWPYAALDDGLLFREAHAYRLWDPETERTMRTVPAGRIGDAGPTFGNVVASCGRDCRDLVLTDFADGSRRVVQGLEGRRLVTFEAQFSPDGTKLAIPVLAGTHGWKPYSERGRRLAIVDLASGEIDVIPSSAVPPGYVYTAWSSDGRQAFLTGGAINGDRGAIVDYRVGSGRARHLDVHPDAFYGLVAG